MRTDRTAPKRRSLGLTLVEVLFGVLILAVLIRIALPQFQQISLRTHTSTAVSDINRISNMIEQFYAENRRYPDDLAEIGQATALDPWGRTYQYLDVTLQRNRGQARKDHRLVPINSDFDLYSMGPDGQSVPPLTGQPSRDDIVRANNGAFIDLASKS
jgi:general secretion pathway protein G